MRPQQSPIVVLIVASTLLAVAGVTPGEAQTRASRCATPSAPASDLLSVDLDSLINTKVITASKFVESVSDAPGAISVISRDDLQRFGGTTLGEVLQRVPGLAESTTYFTDRAVIVSRGDQTRNNGGHVLFLIDGRPTREILEGGLITDLLASFPVSVLDHVEVVKGPGSVLYGSNAYSAVVNLITVKNEATGMKVTALGGSSGGLGVGHAAFSCGRFNLIGAGQFRRLAQWTTTYLPPRTGAVVATGPQAAVIPDQGPSAFIRADYRGLTVASMFTQSETGSFVQGLAGVTKWRRGFADVGYHTAVTDDWDMSVNASYTRNTLGAQRTVDITRDSKELVLEWTSSVRPSSKSQVTVGGLYNYVQGYETYFGVTPSLTISEGHRNSAAVYAQVDHRVHRTLKAIGGFQANKIGSTSLDVVPRVGLIWNPEKRVNLKVLWGQAFRAPSINENRLDHPVLQGNPDLTPEKVATFDLSLSYRTDRTEGGVGYFRSHQTHNITVDTSGTRWRYANQGTATFQGVELDGKYYATKSVYLVASMLYQENHDGAGREHIVPVGNFGGKLGVSYQGENGLTASLFDGYQDRVDGYSGAANPLPNAFHMLNAHVRLDLAHHMHARTNRGVALVLHVNNLRDTEVWLPGWGGNVGDTIPVHRGRAIYAGAEVSFGGAHQAASR
jgi:outer membrane receptor for ferrienterochelin and colicins